MFFFFKLNIMKIMVLYSISGNQLPRLLLEKLLHALVVVLVPFAGVLAVLILILLTHAMLLLLLPDLGGGCRGGEPARWRRRRRRRSIGAGRIS